LLQEEERVKKIAMVGYRKDEEIKKDVQGGGTVGVSSQDFEDFFRKQMHEIH
jgi:hypothetical protein